MLLLVRDKGFVARFPSPISHGTHSRYSQKLRLRYIHATPRQSSHQSKSDTTICPLQPFLQPGPEVAEQLSIYQASLKEKTRQMKAMASELNMYQAQVMKCPL